MGLTSFESAPEQSNIPRQYLHTESTVAELVAERPARLEASATQGHDSRQYAATAAEVFQQPFAVLLELCLKRHTKRSANGRGLQ